MAKSKVYRPPFSTDGDVLALMDRPARWRSGDVGVMAGESAVHVAPSAHRVPGLMAELLGWLGRAEEHPLIASSVVHYELEFIHPFADDNGRIGRLWQTLILSRWRGLFADLPVETLVHAHQDAYYRAIAESTEAASATPFVLFMLTMKGVGRAYRLRSACPESRRPL